MINALSETPKRRAICYAFEPETRLCRCDKRKVVLKGVYISDPIYVKACTGQLRNAAAQWQGIPRDLYSR